MCFLIRKRDAGPSDPLARERTQPTEGVTRVSRRPSVPMSPIHTINTEQPKDDAAIMRLFNLIDSSITDHVINYYITNVPGTSNSDRIAQFGKNKKLQWIQRVAAASHISEARMQVIVIRSIIGAEIFKAVRDGVFVPPMPEMNQNSRKPGLRGHQSSGNPSAATIDHTARIDFFHSLPRDPNYIAHRQKAIANLTDAIMRLTHPLVSNKISEDARQRNLESIVNSAADFAVTIGKQKPAFRVSFPQLRNGNAGGSRRGRGENTDMPVLVPELRKYGDERGLNYDKYIPLVAVQMLPDGL